MSPVVIPQVYPAPSNQQKCRITCQWMAGLLSRRTGESVAESRTCGCAERTVIRQVLAMLDGSAVDIALGVVVRHPCASPTGQELKIAFDTRRSRVAALLACGWLLFALAVSFSTAESCDYRERCAFSVSTFAVSLIALGIFPLGAVFGFLWVRAAPSKKDGAISVRSTSSEVSIDNGPRCVACGAPTTLRTSKTGEYAGRYFWGCTRFPQCVRIVPLSPEDTLKIKGVARDDT